MSIKRSEKNQVVERCWSVQAEVEEGRPKDSLIRSRLLGDPYYQYILITLLRSLILITVPINHLYVTNYISGISPSIMSHTYISYDVAGISPSRAQAAWEPSVQEEWNRSMYGLSIMDGHQKF